MSHEQLANQPANDQGRTEKRENKSEQVEKGADSKLQHEAGSKDRQALSQQELKQKQQDVNTRTKTPHEVASLAKRGVIQSTLGTTSKQFLCSPRLVETHKDGTETVILPGRTPDEVKMLMQQEKASERGRAEPLPKQPNFDRAKEAAMNMAQTLAGGGLYESVPRSAPMPEAMSGVPRVAGADGVFRYAGQISNIPEVSQGIQGVQDLKGLGEGIAQGVGKVATETIKYLSQPQAVENSLLGIGPALDTAVNYYGNNSRERVSQDAKQFAAVGAEAVEQNLGHSMTQNEVGKPAGEIASSFFIPVGASKVLSAREMEALGGMKALEKMTPQELGNLGLSRFEMPRLKLDHDEYSIQASIPGDRKAWFRADVPQKGTVVITDLDKGALPDGLGGHFTASALKGHGMLPTEKLVLKNVINMETIDALKAGVAPADTLLGKCAAKTLKELGITAKNYRVESVAGKLNLVIETK